MGKIKVRTLGGELEEQEKKEQKKKSEEKKFARLQAPEATADGGQAKVPGKGGERVVVVGPSEEELAKLEQKTAITEAQISPQKTQKLGDSVESSVSSVSKKKAKFEKAKRARSKKYLAKATLLDKSKKYELGEALKILEQMQSPAKQDLASREKNLPAGRQAFDETVELHFNTKEGKISAQTTLPHGTGKSLKVKIASDELIEQIEKGKVDFDILLAKPDMMPKLAKVAKVLGPKGLMPNPKNGTIVNDPEEAAKKYEGGLTFIKTESKAPIVHIAVGKVSFGPKKLEENIDAVVSAVKRENIKDATLKSTMSPGIKLQI